MSSPTGQGPTFSDPPDTGVFLARTVFEQLEELDNVTHDLDGDWIFSGPSEVPDSADAWVLAHLIHIVERHPHVVAISDLPLGWAAELLPTGIWARFPLESTSE